MKTRAGLRPTEYYETQIFEQERTTVFESSWIFVGFKDQLQNTNDFITLTIGKTPVVVQNLAGELNALLNICSHRKATLQNAPSGNRPLICPYHCWSYKNKGELHGVPQNKEFFALDDEQKKQHSLKQFALDVCGNFVFVRVSPVGPSLHEFLGEHYGALELLSDYFTETIKTGIYDWKTNWKIAVETVLEVYHVPGTHPQSFAKLAIAECEVISHPPHTIGITPMQDSSKKWWDKVRNLLKLKHYEPFTEYTHFLIYPNLAIGVTNGSLMSVQTYDPVDAQQCKLNFRLRLIGKSEDAHVSTVVKETVIHDLVAFNNTTLEEDRVVAESCQKNMLATQIPAILGSCEQRIWLFHEAWHQQMDNHHEHI
jgi:phenylpropionate dioxygenase-like ring-hydroxylating dioxygenase large terminal subunit